MKCYRGLPKDIKIGPYYVAVFVRPKLEEDDLGTYCHAGQTMELLEDMPTSSMAADVLLHELFHALYKTFQLSPSDAEERVVSVFATGMTQIFQDNPDLVRWLQRASK